MVPVLGAETQDGGLSGTATVSIQKLTAPQLGHQVVVRKKNGDFPCDIFLLNHSMIFGSLFGFCVPVIVGFKVRLYKLSIILIITLPLLLRTMPFLFGKRNMLLAQEFVHQKCVFGLLLFLFFA